MLTWRPLPVLGDFEWQDLPFGSERFSVKLALTGRDPSATVGNPNSKPVTVRLRLPAPAGTRLAVADRALPSTDEPYFGESGVAAEFPVPAGGTVTVSLRK